MTLVNMIKQAALTVLLSGIVFCPLRSAGQGSMISSIQDQFNRYRLNVLQEKLYAHTDKNFYLAGEILWFKLYSVDASQHHPLDLSKVAYVEVLDNNNTPLLQAKISLKEGEGSGSFSLPVTIHSGEYKIRAYTNWMKNWGADHFFEKTITIINARKAEAIADTSRLQAYDIQFFPEGGNLVEAIQSKVAFKVTNQDGKGLECKGFIINEVNDTVLNFRPRRFGIGSFFFTPLPGHVYKAIIEVPGKSKIIKDLPVIYNKGYVMNLSDEGADQVKITVQATGIPASEIYLFVHTRQSVKVAESATIQNGKAVFMIGKKKLGDGIAHFTIFNSAKQPMCERLYFKYPEQALQILLKTDNSDYAERGKINIDILSTDESGKALAAGMSMAVYRLDSLQEPDEMNIINYLLLGSDLKGTIESPGYYFKDRDKETATATDDLMLTHGWRRFRWQEVLGDSTPAFAFVPEYNGHIVTGKITGITDGKPAENITGYLSVPGLRTQFMPSVSNKQGGVQFEMKEMYGSSEIIAQTDPGKDSLYKVDITLPFFDAYSSSKLPAFHLSPDHPNTLLDHSVSAEVQNMYTRQEFHTAVADTNAFYSSPNETYFLDSYTRFMTLEEVLREYVALLNVKRKNGRFHLPVSDIPGNAPRKPGYPLFETDPLILLDGLPLFDIDKFMEYNPLKIRKLEVVHGRYFYGNARFDGILNWTTYKGDLKDFELDPRAVVMDYEGLQLEREFYAPVYDNEQKRNSHLPDFRNVLYWSPDIRTDNSGTGQLSFYASDLRGKYIVVLQGLARDGRCGSAIVNFNVK